jgi:hypothetical protein
VLPACVCPCARCSTHTRMQALQTAHPRTHLCRSSEYPWVDMGAMWQADKGFEYVWRNSVRDPPHLNSKGGVPSAEWENAYAACLSQSMHGAVGIGHQGLHGRRAFPVRYVRLDRSRACAFFFASRMTKVIPVFLHFTRHPADDYRGAAHRLQDPTGAQVCLYAITSLGMITIEEMLSVCSSLCCP